MRIITANALSRQLFLPDEPSSHRYHSLSPLIFLAACEERMQPNSYFRLRRTDWESQISFIQLLLPADFDNTPRDDLGQACLKLDFWIQPGLLEGSKWSTSTDGSSESNTVNPQIRNTVSLRSPSLQGLSDSKHVKAWEFTVTLWKEMWQGIF